MTTMLFWILTWMVLILSLPALTLAAYSAKGKGRKVFFRYSAISLLPVVLLLIFGFTADAMRTYSPTDFRIVGTFILIILTYAAVQWIMAIACMLAWLTGTYHPLCKKLFLAGGILMSTLIVSMGIYGRSIGIWKLHCTKDTLSSSSIPPAFHNYRIALFTDFHLGTFGTDTTFAHRVVDSIMQAQPDIILFGGDLVNYDTKEIIPFLPVLSRLHAPDGVYAVMGNHDYQENRHWNSPVQRQNSVNRMKKLLSSVGWTLLDNESRFLVKESDSIALIGTENDGLPPFPSLGDLQKATRQLTNTLSKKKHFSILLTHDPTCWKRKVVHQTNISLTLSGHTHACQFQWGDFSPASWKYAEWAGWYNQGDQHLFVSKGVGEAFLFARIGAWPEINLITLHHLP